MPTLTSNFEFQKPLVNNATDADLWGGQLNTNWDDIDTDLALTTATKTASTFNIGATEFNFTYLIDASSNTVTGTLPAASTVFNGFVVRFKPTDVTNTITIDGNGSETIDGDLTKTIDSLGAVLEIVCDGTNWRVNYFATASQSEAEAGTVDDKSMTPERTSQAIAALASSITLGTEQATTSGTAFDFTGIPAGTNRITMMFDSVSLSGTDSLLVQLGDSGGIETTGYVSRTANTVGGTETSTAGFISRSNAASNANNGAITLTRMDSNKWVSTGTLEDSTNMVLSSGVKTLSGELTQIRLTRDGSNTFDAGAVNITSE